MSDSMRSNASDPEDLPDPPNTGPWQCFFCGEVFTVAGAAADHFGAEPDFATPGCLIDYRVQLEAGGTPERGRGLLMELRKREAEVTQLQHEATTHDEATQTATASYYELLRWVSLGLKPGWTVERLIEYLHAHRPSHGGLAAWCPEWPCTVLAGDHRFTPPDQDQVDRGADVTVCIVCGHQETFTPRHPEHLNA